MKTMKRDFGYTIVEILVVVAIITVLAGITSLSISILFSRDAELAAKTIDDQLSEVRMAAMTKPGSYSITIYTTATGSGNHIEIEKGELNLVTPVPGTPAPTPLPQTPINDILIEKDAYITFGVKDHLPSDASEGSIKISFDKANGSVKEIIIDGAATSEPLDEIYEIKCKGVRNKTKEATISIMPVTGRHYLE